MSDFISRYQHPNLSFLKKSIRWVFVLGIITIMGAQGLTQERDLRVYPYWKYYSNMSNSLYETLAETAFDQLENRQKIISKLSTRQDWLQRQQYVKTTLQDIVGPFPKKTPLNPVVTGTIRRDGMVIEKLYFESRPGFYVTAMFCKPENIQSPVPAIVFCSGHTAEGFRSETYQHMIFNYVKKGFAVLAFDPIGQGERIQYLDEEGKPRMGSTHEHSYPGSQSFLAGISPANYFIWDGIRAVDYLLTREEVDPNRLGMTGRSGGGTQTAYIAAMDDRIYAAAPECYITTFDKLLKSNGPQDAEQNLMHGIAKGIDMPDYIDVRAPKPTLIVSTTRDIFAIQGVRDTYAEAKKAYAALGEPGHIEKVEDDAGHTSTLKNREATYTFFRKHLNFPGRTTDEKVEIFTPEELWVTPTGNVYRDLGGEDIFSLTKKYIETKEKPKISSRSLLQQQVKDLSGYQPIESTVETIFSGRTEYDNFNLEKFLVKGSGSYYLPVVWLKPHRHTLKTLIFLDEHGKDSIGVKDGWIDQLLNAGYAVVLADLSGMGELAGGYPGGDARIKGTPLNVWYAGILANRSLIGIHAEEINRIYNFVKDSDQNKTSVTLIGKGVVTSDLLHAAFLGQVSDNLVFIRPLISYRSILKDREYDPKYLMSAIAGGIIHYDLQDLLPDLSNTLIIDPVDANNEVFNGIVNHMVKYSSNETDMLSILKAMLK